LENILRTPAVNAALQKTLTAERLRKYLLATDNDLDLALKLYEENMRLSEAFYAPLQCLEVCLRNTLHDQLTAKYGAHWFQNGAPQFNAISEQMITDALWELKNKPPPIDPNDVVAELKFAFWVGILGPHYDATLWRQALYKAFRVGGGKPRSTVHHRFNAVRRFRNRIMHHEPIFQRPLQQLHDEIIDAIGWMCADTAAWTAHHSRFETVIATRDR
jgi:hypothetical protein